MYKIYDKTVKQEFNAAFKNRKEAKDGVKTVKHIDRLLLGKVHKYKIRRVK